MLRLVSASALPRVLSLLVSLVLSLLFTHEAAAFQEDLVQPGEVVAGYRLDHLERHPEFLRLHFEREGEGDRTVVEIGRFDDPEGPWTTGRHRLMPAPQQQPPEALMLALMERLREHDRRAAPPLVQRERSPRRVGDYPQLDPLPARWVLACALGGLGWAFLYWRRRSRALIERAARQLEAHPWPWLGLILAAMTLPRLVHLDLPFSADAMTQRLFFGSLDVGDIFAHRYADQRHPQLFYLILHIFLRFGHSETVARLPALIFSLAAAGMLFALARARLGVPAALLATTLLGLSLPFLMHSREVGDITLFTFLALASSHLILRAIARPTPTLLALLLVAEVAMFYTYYLAPLVAAAHLFTVIVHARAGSRRRVLGALSASWLFALPNLGELWQLVREDQGARNVAHAFPRHMWGERTAVELLGEAGKILAPSAATLLLLVGLAWVGALRRSPRFWRDPLATLCVPLLLLSFSVLGAAVALVRLKPYYLLFTLPFLLLLAAAGAVGRSRKGSFGPLLAGAGMTASLLLFAAHVQMQRLYLEEVLWPGSQPRNDELGAFIRQQARHDPPGPRTVIADGNNLHTILIYYAFEDPLTMYRGCRLDPEEAFGTRCRRGDEELVTLTVIPRLTEGWEERALDRLLEVQRGRDSWVVYTERFPNEPLFRDLVKRCEVAGHFDQRHGLELFRCPALP
jgi:hypothetical protein